MNARRLYATFSVILLGLSACHSARFPRDSYIDGRLASSDSGSVNVVIEIPAGTNDNWEVEKTTGSLHWEQKNGKPKVIQDLAHPANCGMIPRTSLPREVGGDGDPLDVLLLGPHVERGSILRGRPIGVLQLMDDSRRDDKILAIQTAGSLSDVPDVEALDSRCPGILQIVEMWFGNYKGPGRITSDGFGNAAQAMAVVREASRH